MIGCLLVFPLLLGFHANLPMLNSTWPGPVGETYSISPAGSDRSPFQVNARRLIPPSSLDLWQSFRSHNHPNGVARAYCRLLPPREIAKSFGANGMVGRGGGDRIYEGAESKGTLRNVL